VDELADSASLVDDRGIPSVQPRAVNSMDALADPAFRAAMASADFNRLPYLPSLRAVVRAVLGRYIHYDYGVSGVQDMLTSWVPGRPGRRPARTLTPGYRAPGLEALAPAAPGGRALGGPGRGNPITAMLVPAERHIMAAGEIIKTPAYRSLPALPPGESRPVPAP
jgi:hypothetical protein